MPATIKHIFSNAIADGTNTNIVRPVDWNSVHAITLNISGTDISAAFSNLNGVSFGTEAGGKMTASIQTSYAASNHSHGNPTLALTNLSGTTASNSAGLTLSLSANAAAAGVGIEAGTRTATTAGNLRFETGNGITFGLNGVGGSVMTASHNAITTGRASNDAIGLNTALTANGVSMTANSSGLSLNFPAFLTTAAQSSASNVSGVIAGTNATGGTATLSGNVSFSNANGISFYTSAGNAVVGTVRTDYQSAGAYLTTAALSNHSHGNPTLNLTNINGTTASNSAGLTLSLSAIVPAQSVQPVAASASNGSYNFSTLKFVEGSGVTWATQANGIQASVKTDYLTTAMLSNAATLSNIRVSGGTTSNLLSAITFADSNGVSFGLNAGTLTATVKTDYQTAGAYLTTAMASNRGSDFVQANAVFNGTNASGTIASNGISVSVAGPQAGVGIAAGTRTATTAGNLLFDTGNGITFGLDVVGGSIMTASHNGLTTAMASNRGSDFMGTATALTAGPLAWTANSAGLSLNASSVAGTTTGFAGTNISGSMTHNTAGLSINLSVAAPGAGGGIALSAGSDSNFTNGTVTFGNAFSGSFVTSNGSVVYSNAFLTTAAQSNHSHGNPTLALTNLSGTTASASNGLTLSLSAAAPGGGAAATYYDWDNYPVVGSMNLIGNLTATAWSRARPLLFPLQVDGHLVWNRARINVSRSTSGSNAFTINCGLYSFVNSTQISLVGSFQNTYTASDTGSISGIRAIEITHANTNLSSLTPGHYIGALGFSASGDNTASMNYSLRGGVTVNPPVGIIRPGAGVNITATSDLSSIASRAFKGVYSATSSVMPGSIGLTQMSMWTTGGGVPYFWMGSQ